MLDVLIMLIIMALVSSNVYLVLLSKEHRIIQSHTIVTMVASIKKSKNVFVKLAAIRVTKMLKTPGLYQTLLFFLNYQMV